MADSGGVNPAHIYAFEKLGYFVREGEEAAWTDEQLTAWDEAVAEWEAIHGGGCGD